MRALRLVPHTLIALGLLSGCGDAERGDPADTTGPGGTEDIIEAEPCSSDAACRAEDPSTSRCNLDSGLCEGPPAGYQIGFGDGSADTVEITTIFTPNRAYEATDLAFHPERDELWVINREFDVPGVCAESAPNSARCQSLAGFVQIIFNAGKANQEALYRMDGNAWHFMRRPLAMAMGGESYPSGESWASCSEASTGNFEDNDVLYNGPSLWSLDLSIFAQPSGQNGSHLDMLHATPWCVGIAHEEDNVYWLFNGHLGAIDRYDFAEDHGPGWHDHSDGSIYRYAEGQLKREPNVPGHMQFNHADDHVYISDTGHGRIVKLDSRSGTFAGPFRPNYEPLADYGVMTGATLLEVVPPGQLVHPGAMVLHDDLLYVCDHASSRLHVFELDGTELRTLDTGLAPYTIGGMTMGRDDRIYFANMATGQVHRIDPKVPQGE